MKTDVCRYEGHYLSLVERDHWEFVTRPNAHAVVVLIAVTDQDELVLVEQYRRPVNARVIELPAGLVGDTGDPDEPILEAADRELVEETGFKASLLQHVMDCPTSAGITDEVISFVRASGLERVGPGGGDDSEDIDTHLVPMDQVSGWLRQRHAEGLPLDPKIYTALYWLTHPDD